MKKGPTIKKGPTLVGPTLCPRWPTYVAPFEMRNFTVPRRTAKARATFLFDLDLGAFGLKFCLDRLGFVFGHARLDRLGSAFDKVLSFFQA